MYVTVGMHVPRRSCVDVRGQLLEVGFRLPFAVGTGGMNSGYQACTGRALIAELSPWPIVKLFLLL